MCSASCDVPAFADEVDATAAAQVMLRLTAHLLSRQDVPTAMRPRRPHPRRSTTVVPRSVGGRQGPLLGRVVTAPAASALNARPRQAVKVLLEPVWGSTTGWPAISLLGGSDTVDAVAGVEIDTALSAR